MSFPPDRLRPALLAAAAAAALVSALTAPPAQAAEFAVAGTLVHHNDVALVDFTLAAAADVRVWTDAWRGGLNFDPAAALWSALPGGDWALLASVDDDDTVGAGQGFYDAGFALPALAAGRYRVSLTPSPNGPLGARLGQGFLADGEVPIPLALWDQPSHDPNLDDQKGGAWGLRLTGVDSVAVVPEPASALLAALGLAGLALRLSRRA